MGNKNVDFIAVCHQNYVAEVSLLKNKNFIMDCICENELCLYHQPTPGIDKRVPLVTVPISYLDLPRGIARKSYGPCADVTVRRFLYRSSEDKEYCLCEVCHAAVQFVVGKPYKR
ncbi:hypothetical protein NTGM5_480028 [Candidatus Nitrotoga sp. M5]|nr:hypothetical protein NTGM5_480028 [Candidatus Nitrotoga sp. M5]